VTSPRLHRISGVEISTADSPSSANTVSILEIISLNIGSELRRFSLYWSVNIFLVSLQEAELEDHDSCICRRRQLYIKYNTGNINNFNHLQPLLIIQHLS